MVPPVRPNEMVRRHHTDEVAALLRAVLESRGASAPTAREAAFRGTDLPAPLGEYVAKVRDSSYRIGDGDIGGLLAAGYSQDVIFEITVAAALGAAARGLDAGLRALKGGG